MQQKKRSNHLSDSTSPYLQQHAHNPVQWYPWGPQALDRAREEDKPILLSIGYSACHWCHVMAHESFEDEQTARVMNELFINIKVDREERPDLDKIYQTAHQLLTQRSGGWPLTMFLMPDDHVPFFGGTYFPPEARYNMPSFRDVMVNVEQYYRSQRPDLEKQNDSVMSALNNFVGGMPGDAQLNTMPLDMARQQLEKSFDPVYGGFGAAPKFPHPTNVERLLRHWSSTRNQSDTTAPDVDEHALHMATQTLHAMASGGLYDQLGGGFYRYSVDERWEIPHFEKMLYDNGPLLGLYCDAYRATQNPVFKRIVRETADWVIDEMQSPQGGYYSTLDADSEGEEGKFYVWSRDEVRGLLSDKEQYAVFEKTYGLDEKPNFEGAWHLCVRNTVADVARELDMSEQHALQLLDGAKHALLCKRQNRIAPGRDEKVLTSWNGLMIKGMAEAGRLLDDDKYIDSATRALDFIKSTMWSESGLYATSKDGKAHLTAYLDDYVFVADAVLTLLQARWCSQDLVFACQLVDVVLEKFTDKEQGGMYFTASDHEALLMRLKPYSDDSLPSGNGVAASVLLRLGHLLGNKDYLEVAGNVFKAAWADISQMPYAHNALLAALEQYFYPVQQVIVRGDEKQLSEFRKKMYSHFVENYVPDRIVVLVPESESGLPGMLDDYKAVAGDVVAYSCKGAQCQPPVSGLDKIIDLL